MSRKSQCSKWWRHKGNNKSKRESKGKLRKRQLFSHHCRQVLAQWRHVGSPNESRWDDFLLWTGVYANRNWLIEKPNKTKRKNRKQRGNKKTGTQLTGSARRRADTTRKKQENSEVTPGWKQTSWRTRQREKHRLNTERVVNKWNTGEQEK